MAGLPRLRLALVLLAVLLVCWRGSPPSARGAPAGERDALARMARTGPDTPLPLAHDPTALNQLPAADPAASINLIAPPAATSSGQARLSYPIELPPGRQGMAPALALTYDSGGGNGWLGVGWNLHVSAIAIDTRWGVPRYDAARETETYLLDNDQLTPVAHRGDPPARTADKTFHTRVEGQFRRIIRHGNQPDNYWWEVVDKEGVRSFYGGDPETNAPAADATLATASGAIFHWALREMRDPHGNGVRYSYQRISDVGVAGGSVPGTQLYLREINYTRANGAAGPHSVKFTRDSELSGYGRRPDVLISGRGGFKMVTAELLRRIEITFNGALIRRYDLTYQEGAFRKSLLASISQSGEDGALFHSHQFSYHDDIREGAGYRGFEEGPSWNTGADDVALDLLGLTHASALSGASTTDINGHLYVGFNPISAGKTPSAGGKIGFSFNDTDTVLAMIDINADNLPDKVFKDGGQIYFRLNQSGPGGGTAFGPVRPIPTLTDLGTEQSIMISGGAEAYVIANVFINHAETFTTGSIYFHDVNADGLPDLVTNGQVLFNHLDAAGVPTFNPDSSLTPVPIGAGAVDAAGLIADYTSLLQRQLDAMPPVDTLRRWVAPFSGQVRITGNVALIRDTSPARSAYQTADGVRVAVQHNGGELWSARITADDYAAKTPTGVNAITVQAGDRIYFRVGSVFDGRYDQVAWDPEVVYLNVPAATDANQLNPYRYRASEDFTLAGRRGMQVRMPLTGTARLTGDLTKTGATSDDVTLLVLKNGAQVFAQTLAAAATGAIILNQDIAVLANDTVELRVRVDSSIDVSKVQWTPRLFYVATADPNQRLTDAQGNFIIQLQPPYDIDLYPGNNLTAPQAAWTATAGGTLSVIPRLTAAAGTNGAVAFTVKRAGALVAKRTATVTNGAAAIAPFTISVSQGERLFFDFSAYDPELGEGLSGSVEVTFGNPNDPSATRISVPSAVHRALAADDARINGLYPQPYRGWAVAGYNANGDRGTRAIVESELRFQRADYDRPECRDPQPSQDPFASPCTPSNAKAYHYAPLPGERMWRGPDDHTWVMASSAGSSRLGADFIDVPRPGSFAGARAVSRIGRTSQTSVGAGVSLLSGSVSGLNPLPGSSWADTDLIDLNGDQFPDVVGNGRAQFTTPSGGLEAAGRAISGLERVRESDDLAYNLGIGGTPASFEGNASGEVNTSGQRAPRGNKSGSQMASLGVSGGLAHGDSQLLYDLLDVNGDGLPDRVSSDGGSLRVALNLGYSFAPAETWGNAVINDGASRTFSVGVGLGFNGGTYDFAGGVSLERHVSRGACKAINFINPLDESCAEAGMTLLDVNGDGLLDRVTDQGATLRVGFNTGNGFAADINWTGALADGVAARSNTSLGGGVYLTFGIGPLCLVGCYIIINPGADGGGSMSRQESQVLDVDGDGYPDHLASTSDGALRVARNRTGRTNLLKTVQRPLGGRIELDYVRTGNTPEQPDSRWALARVALGDGHPGDGADTRLITYRYQGGVYDQREREFYGFASVVEEHRDAGNGDALFRTVEREYLVDSFYTVDRPRRERVLDAAGRPFGETEHSYRLRDVSTGATADPRGLTATVFPELARVDRRYFEGNPTAAITTHSTYEYDALGNMTRRFDANDAGADDDLELTTSYSTTCTSSHIVGIPTRETVRGDGAVMREREQTVDCATGNVTSERHLIAGGDAAVTDYEYFGNGNVRQVTGPANPRGERYRLTYTYDPDAQTHVASVTDSHGLTTTTTHQPKYGRPLLITDPNGNRMTYTYDRFGRTASVTGPYEQGGATPTIRFEHHHDAAVPWALSRNIDALRGPGATIDTAVFVDGLGRVVQTKKDGTVHGGPDSPARDVMIVSGRVTFDPIGRVTEQYHPTTEPRGTAGTFNAARDSVQPTRLTYDVLDRVTRTTIPDNTATVYAHGFGQDREGATRFETAITDGNSVRRHEFRAVSDMVTAVRRLNEGGAQSIWTSYAYDPLDQLVRVTDDRNNVTTVAYDTLGRRTVIDSPDAGRTETVYDPASNVIATITANLRDQGARISYDYDFNRLTRVQYPNFPANNVSYTYGAPGSSGNRAGRITRVSDGSGSEERSYGPLGEVTRAVRSIAASGDGFTTEYSYDTWGRLRTLTYPDGEVLTYQYDGGGQVRSATGRKANETYEYARRLEYDKFEQRAFVEFGNGVRTSYSYRPDNRRLAALASAPARGDAFQNLSYRYDNVGNVLSTANNVPLPRPSGMGGPVTQTFTYDDLYRLTGATGVFQTAPGKTDRYRLSLTYDTIDNPLTKRQTHELVQPSGSVVGQHKTTYDFAYQYAGPQPHAATGLDNRTYRYDANGNSLGWTHDQNGTRREITWDEENRIQAIADNGQVLRYGYDHAGQRVVKRGPGGETVYVNPFFSIRNGTDGTKHVYAGETRIVSKLMKMDRPGSNPRGRPPREKDLFFFHPDHLGSTGFVTDTDGALSQHEQYFPFGETWVEEGNGGARQPYQYSAKELDDETGLYYYGARYYDPRTNRWQSADPALSMYLDQREMADDGDDHARRRRLPRAGLTPLDLLPPDAFNEVPDAGVYDPSNLDLYAYTGQNPLNFIDDDGLAKKKNKHKPKIKDTVIAGGVTKVTVQIPIDQNTKFYKTARHMRRGVKRGHPTTLTINRPGAAANRAASLKGIATKSGKDRDEYPPAMFTQGGAGAHVRLIKAGDNRSMGAHLGNLLQPYTDGTQVKFKFKKYN